MANVPTGRPRGRPKGRGNKGYLGRRSIAAARAQRSRALETEEQRTYRLARDRQGARRRRDNMSDYERAVEREENRLRAARRREEDRLLAAKRRYKQEHERHLNLLRDLVLQKTRVTSSGEIADGAVARLVNIEKRKIERYLKRRRKVDEQTIATDKQTTATDKQTIATDKQTSEPTNVSRNAQIPLHQTVTVSEYPVHRMQQVPIRNHPHSQQGPGHPHSQQSPYLVRSAAPNYFMQQPQSGMLPGNVPLPPGHPGNVPPGHPALQMHHQHPSGPSLQQHSVPPVQHPVPPVQHPTVTYSNKDLQVHKDQQGHPALHKDQQLVVPDSVSSTSDSEKKDFTTPLKKSPPGSPVSVNSSPTTDATIKIRRSGSGDFFEVELADIGDTYSSLRKCFAEELDVEESSVCKIRKLPNILIRKDRDIKRIKHGAEFEVEVAEEMS